MKKLFWVALLGAMPAPAGAMDVATFLAKADALKAKGMMAMFSSDLKLLKEEINGQAKALGDEQDKAKAAGRNLGYCLPNAITLDSNEILASFHAIPAAQQPRMSVKDGLRALFARKYPCR